MPSSAALTPEISTLSLHDALPIYRLTVVEPRHAELLLPRRVQQGQVVLVLFFPLVLRVAVVEDEDAGRFRRLFTFRSGQPRRQGSRSEEHTSELQSRQYLVCRLLLR